MQNHHQNPINNLNNPLQLESEQVVYTVEVSMEMPDCVAFASWLKEQGHCASVVDSECSFINGTPAFIDFAYFVFKGLYSAFLNTQIHQFKDCAVCGHSCDTKFCPNCGACVSCQE